MTYSAAIEDLQKLLKDGVQPILSLSGFLSQANHAVREHPTGEFRLVALERISNSMAKAILLGAEFTGSSMNAVYYENPSEVIFSYPLDSIEIVSRTGTVLDKNGRDTRLVLAERLCPNPIGLAKWARDKAVECFINQDMTSAISVAAHFYLTKIDRNAKHEPIKVSKHEDRHRETREKDLMPRLQMGMG